MKKFPFYKQLDTMDCGPTCLRMISKHYGKSVTLQYLRERSFITREGVSMLGISEAAESIGLKTLLAKIPFEKMKEVPLPLIAHWRQRHFVVVYKIKHDRIYVADPSHGKISFSREEFLDGWLSTNANDTPMGLALLLEPTPLFYEQAELGKSKGNKRGIGFFLIYLKPYKQYLVQLVLGLLLGSILQLLFPFLTQSIVDIGIENQDINFINLILVAQLMLFLGRTAGEYIRSWILLHLGTRLNISFISDFLLKLTRLPIAFFDTKMIGDILQRINDHARIENLLTSTSLSTLFSLFNLIVFGAVLAYYNLTIFFIFLSGSSIYIIWILMFLKKRRNLDHKRFDQLASNQSNLIQLIMGMQEIKLNNAEKQKRWEWEAIQARLFSVGVQGLALEQYQQVGSGFINELKNIIITFVAAKAVISGSLTLGMMLSIQYILGQLNTPIIQLVNFIRSFQDAQISMERLGEIYDRDDEETENEHLIKVLPDNRSLFLNDVSFQYDGPHSPSVLRNISAQIEEGKITAIVGSSGSGKTTLLKLLLKFYEPTEGEIDLGGIDLKKLSHRVWRSKCGTVFQDGYIFSDTIANNIGVSADHLDQERLKYAVKVANIQEFIESLPLGYNTKIGNDGHALSQGQRQRILIARSVYKNPEYLFFDEATNALDANNEKIIMNNLDQFFKGRTVVVVAHRLSTVKNADKILVLENGEIIEFGNHTTLAKKRGAYYELVKNQLELGS